MSVISNTVAGARRSASLLKNLAANRAVQALSATLLVGGLLTPLFVPLINLALYAVAAAALTMALGYPAMKLASDSFRKTLGWFPSRSSSTPVGKSKEQVKKVSDGKATGNTVVDALADKLRKSGLKVSTDWKEAEKILKDLPEKYNHLKNDKDALRGFVYQGAIFLNPKNADESVPIHEYTHVWAEALRQKNPEEWKHIVKLLKNETVLWEDVKANYPHLTTEDEVADEVLATYSGNYGMEKLGQYYKEGQKPQSAFEDLRKALEIFWKEVSKFFKCHFDTKESIADRVLYDLLSGVNPERYIDENTVTLSDQGPQTARYGGKYPRKKTYTPADSSNQREGKSEGDSQSGNAIKQKAIEKFSSLLIARMEEMQESNWKKGWISNSSAAGLPQNIHSGVLNGTNRFILQMHTAMNGYTMPLYMTFNQAIDVGVHVKKGEESIPVVYWGFSYRDKDGKRISEATYNNMSDAEKEEVEKIPFLKGYYEFNVDQTDMKEVAPEMYAKLLERFKQPEAKDTEGMYVNEAIDRMLERQEWVCPVHYKEPSDSAFYRPSTDEITLPQKQQFKISQTPEEVFKDGMEYYSTFIHEAAHSTGSPERLNRVKGDRFGDKKYAYEECVAEMSAAVVGKTLGFDRRISDNNTQYVGGWIRNIKEKPELIIGMLGDIGKASNMILEKVNAQKIALGEKPILGEESILNDEEKEELKKVSLVKGIVRFLVQLASDPSPYAKLTRQQSYLIDKHLKTFPTQEERNREVSRIWSMAEKDPGMKKLNDNWKATAKDALQAIANGTYQERSEGVKM